MFLFSRSYHGIGASVLRMEGQHVTVLGFLSVGIMSGNLLLLPGYPENHATFTVIRYYSRTDNQVDLSIS